MRINVVFLLAPLRLAMDPLMGFFVTIEAAGVLAGAAALRTDVVMDFVRADDEFDDDFKEVTVGAVGVGAERRKGAA